MNVGLNFGSDCGILNCNNFVHSGADPRIYRMGVLKSWVTMWSILELGELCGAYVLQENLNLETFTHDIIILAVEVKYSINWKGFNGTKYCIAAW